MAIDIHTIANLAGAPFTRTDRVFMGVTVAPYGAGGSAGAAVTVPVTGLDLPPSALVFASLGVDATAFVSGQSSTGLTLTIQPRLASATLAAGSVGVLIVA